MYAEKQEGDDMQGEPGINGASGSSAKKQLADVDESEIEIPEDV